MPGRTWPIQTAPDNTSAGTKPYRFGFNGMESDFEVKGAGNSYDFGARIYDPRLGRFLSVDPLYDKNPAYAPYSFGDDNPILLIDKNGLFRMSKKDQKKYPELTNLLKTIQQTAHNDPWTYQAFKEILGLTDKEADKFLEWGKGPKVKVKDLEEYANTSMSPVFGFGKITIDKKTIDALEGRAPNIDTKTGKGLLFQVYVTLLHEAQHSAENKKFGFLQMFQKYDETDDRSERGRMFEIKAFGKVLENPGDADKMAQDREDIQNTDFTKEVETDKKNSPAGPVE